MYCFNVRLGQFLIFTFKLNSFLSRELSQERSSLHTYIQLVCIHTERLSVLSNIRPIHLRQYNLLLEQIKLL